MLITKIFLGNLLAYYSCVFNKKWFLFFKNLIILVDFYVRLSRLFLLPGSGEMKRIRPDQDPDPKHWQWNTFLFITLLILNLLQRIN